VALAYLLGIVFDRFADTLLSRPEQYHRLKFAIEVKEGKHDFKPKDPFPEDNLQVQILNKGSSASDRMEYLRSRIRLSRALTVFVPALTLSGLLALGKGQDNFPCYLKAPVIMGIMGIMALIYVLSFFFLLIISKHKRWKLPKTWEENMETKVNHNFSWWWEPTTIAAGLLFSMTVFVAIYLMYKGYSTFPENSTFPKTCAVLSTGLGTGALSAWAWWRISETYMKFVNNWKTS
jgi:hypothetical protein